MSNDNFKVHHEVIISGQISSIVFKLFISS